MSRTEEKASLPKEYRKTIMVSVLNAFSFGFAIPLWISTYKLSRIKNGQYPGMPREEIYIRYQEALPSVILNAIIMCLLITIAVSLLIAFFRFKFIHHINLLSECVKYIRNKR